jgi:hypothetical protein
MSFTGVCPNCVRSRLNGCSGQTSRGSGGCTGLSRRAATGESYRARVGFGMLSGRDTLRNLGISETRRSGSIRTCSLSRRTWPRRMRRTRGGACGTIGTRVCADALNHIAIAHDVRVHAAIKDVGRRAENVGGVGCRPGGDGTSAKPIPRWSHRSPTDVAVVRRAPRDPRGGIHAARNPTPTLSGNPNPTAVMERDVAPVVITYPEPIVVGVELPVTCALVGRKVCADDGAVGIPNGPVCGVIGPRAVIGEGFTEIRQC